MGLHLTECGRSALSLRAKANLEGNLTNLGLVQIQTSVLRSTHPANIPVLPAYAYLLIVGSVMTCILTKGRVCDQYMYRHRCMHLLIIPVMSRVRHLLALALYICCIQPVSACRAVCMRTYTKHIHIYIARACPVYSRARRS